MTSLNTSAILGRYTLTSRVAKKVSARGHNFVAERKLRHAVLSAAKHKKHDVAVVFKGNFVSSELLEDLGLPAIHYHPDDVDNPENVTPIYSRAEGRYSMHVTTKRHNVSSVSERAGVPTLFVWCAYDPRWHQQCGAWRDLSAPSRVGFVGTMRSDRSSLVCNIARAYGENFAVFGTGWDRITCVRDYGSTVGPPAFGLDFSRRVADSPIQLGLLNSQNRDQHTCRSFELPAAGALFVGQRTPEHEELFEDRVSALLFSSEAELLSILDRTRSDARWAAAIAARGFNAITANDNTYVDRAIQISRNFSAL